MIVVGHQAIRVDRHAEPRHAEPRDRFRQGVEKQLTVTIVAKNRLAFVAPRRHVINGMSMVHSNRSRHPRKISRCMSTVKS